MRRLQTWQSNSVCDKLCSQQNYRKKKKKPEKKASVTLRRFLEQDSLFLLQDVGTLNELNNFSL